MTMTMTISQDQRRSKSDPDINQSEFASAAVAATKSRRRERLPNGDLYLVETYYQPLRMVMELSTKIARSTSPLLVVETAPRGMARIKLTEMGEEMKAALKTDWGALLGTYCHYKLCPVLKLFARFFRFLPVKNLEIVDRYDMSLKEAQKVEQVVARVMAAVRKRLKSVKMKRRIDNFSRNARNNFGALMNGVDWLAQRHRHVVSVRIDLHLDQKPQLPLPVGAKPDIKAAARLVSLREGFMRWLRETYGTQLLTTTWVLEHGRFTGYHVHFWAVFAPDVAADVEAFAEDLGYKWRAISGGDDECYFNCHTKEAEYRYRMIGHIDFEDPDAIMGIRALCTYFTAAGLLVKLDLGGLRGFGMKGFPDGPLKKPGPKPKVKRPIMRVRLHWACERFVDWI